MAESRLTSRWGRGGPGRLLGLLALVAGLGLLLAPGAEAAAPSLGEAWVTEVSAASATFHGEVNPEGSSTTYRFEYIADAALQKNLGEGHEAFTGAAKAPAGGSAGAGSGTGFVTVSQHVSALKSNTTYHYRLAATGESTSTGSPLTFTTQETGAAFALPDGRGWEMVSPADKNGGAIQGFGQNHGGGVLQAAAAGPGEVTYSSASSFGGSGAQGAPQGNQYISRRGAGGWSTENITAPAVSGSYGNDPNGVPYQLFSEDLSRGLLLNGVHCRGEGSGCPVANPPLVGTGAPAGYQNYYLRDDGSDAYTALLTAANAELDQTPAQFSLALAGASPDLQHIILSTCAKLTANATEVPAGGGGCAPAETNLYDWSGGSLSLINDPLSHHAQLAAQAGAVSTDGRRVYFTAGEDSAIFVREEGQPLSFIANTIGGAGTFQTATPDGAIAFYTVGGHLYRYEATPKTIADLTPAGGVAGVLGASADGATVYYQDAAGLQRWREGTITQLAPGPEAALAADYPPATGTARVSSDGNALLFLSSESLTGYDNHDAASGQPDSEAFLYETGGGGTLRCLSCNPTNERPIGPSTIPGAIANGKPEAAAPGEIVTDSYKPRVLSAGAGRVFFDTEDALVALDTDKAEDVYQWESQGTGSCAKPAGCLSLISSGADGEGASFIDATESGEDAYFLTSSSLVPSDPGSADVYDARVGGGFPLPGQPIPCEGDACQPLPSPPEDPTVGSLIGGAGNPPVHFPKHHHKKPKHHKAKHKHHPKRGGR